MKSQFSILELSIAIQETKSTLDVIACQLNCTQTVLRDYLEYELAAKFF